MENIMKTKSKSSEWTNNHEGFIYVAVNKLFPKYVKIGRSKNVPQRIKELSIDLPVPYEAKYVEYAQNAVLAETTLLREFNHLRVNQKKKEWFKCTNYDDFIQDVKYELKRLANNECVYIDDYKGIEHMVERIGDEYGISFGNGEFYFDFINRLKTMRIKEIKEEIRNMALYLRDLPGEELEWL
jgi:hypothetical protein